MQTHHAQQYTIKILNSNTTLKTVNTKFTVGRSLKCDLRIQLPSVEEKHLVIYLGDRKYAVSGDDVMVNGVVVGGEGVFEYGDVFDVRGTRFVVMEDEGRADVMGIGSKEVRDRKIDEDLGDKKLEGTVAMNKDTVNEDVGNSAIVREQEASATKNEDVANMVFDNKEVQGGDPLVTKDGQPATEGTTDLAPEVHKEVSKIIPRVELTNDTREETEEKSSTTYESNRTPAMEQKMPADELIIEEEIIHREVIKETLSIDTFTKDKIAMEVAGNLKEDVKNDIRAEFVEEIRDELKDEVKDVIGSDGVRNLLVEDVMDKVGEEIKEKILRKDMGAERENAAQHEVKSDEASVKVSKEVNEEPIKREVHQEASEQGSKHEQDVHGKKNEKSTIENNREEDQGKSAVVNADQEKTKAKNVKENMNEGIENQGTQKIEEMVRINNNAEQGNMMDENVEKEPVKRVKRGKSVKGEERKEKDVKKEETKKTRGGKKEKGKYENKAQNVSREEPVEQIKETKNSRKAKMDAAPKKVKKDSVEPEVKKRGRRPSTAKKAVADTKKKGSVTKTAPKGRKKK